MAPARQAEKHVNDLGSAKSLRKRTANSQIMVTPELHGRRRQDEATTLGRCSHIAIKGGNSTMSVKEKFTSAISALARSGAAETSVARRGFFAKAGAALASLPVLSMGSKQAQAQYFNNPSSNNPGSNGPLIIARQGSFMAGGSVI